MKACTLIASLLNEEEGDLEELWLAEILEVKGCTTQGKNIQDAIQKSKELREALDIINELQFIEGNETKNKDEEKSNTVNNDVVGFFLSHKEKTNGSICSDIAEVLDIVKEFDIKEDRGDMAFRRHLGIMLTHLSPAIRNLSIGPWTIQFKSIKNELVKAHEWEGWKDKPKDNYMSA